MADWCSQPFTFGWSAYSCIHMIDDHIVVDGWMCVYVHMMPDVMLMVMRVMNMCDLRIANMGR